MGAASRAEREERRGAEERGWSLRARILGFQLVLFYTIGVRSEPSDWRWMVKNDWAIWAEMGFLWLAFSFSFYILFTIVK